MSDWSSAEGNQKTLLWLLVGGESRSCGKHDPNEVSGHALKKNDRIILVMKILLVALNASYMHTNIAVRLLKVYAEKYLPQEIKAEIQIEFAEFTTNQPVGEVLRGIAESKADVVLFSTYIWNAQFASTIICDVKKVLPGCVIGAGGPEFSYSAKKYLGNLRQLDFIFDGEGERTFVEFVEALVKGNEFSTVKGLYFRNSESFNENGKIVFTGFRDQIENLDEIPFCYPEIVQGTAELEHKIYYYESSRGCPFSCSYCLSSVDKRVRFKSLEKVKQELKIFLDAGVNLVKFVDRTYNLKPERYIEIWKYILENHNGKTMFHFEIEAEHLTEEALEFLQQVPEGIMQFEMGVQTANKKTLETINRSTNVEVLAENIKRIPKTIHQHLDLIAGLPFEDIKSFGESFNFVMNLRPDALQLGFLKILAGTDMEKYARENNWQWMENPVYETFSTPYVPFEDMMFLKDIETVTDAFWNKHNFDFTMNYVFRKMSPWAFFYKLTEYGRQQGSFTQARKDAYWFEFINKFTDELVGQNVAEPRTDISSKFEMPSAAAKMPPAAEMPSTAANMPPAAEMPSAAAKISRQSDMTWDSGDFSVLNYALVKDLLRYDFVTTGKKGNFPEWYKHYYSKEAHMQLLEEKGLLHNNRLAFATSEYEEFDFDVRSKLPEAAVGKWKLLIEYKK